MATRKPPAKAPSDSVVPGNVDAIIIETKYVPTKGLSLYYKNPRVGNVEKIAESLKDNKQYRAIVVNLGTKTKRPNEIAAGNHTYLGARRLGWPTIYAHIIDVDDESLAKIVLADNRTAELGTYDESILTDLMKSLPSLEGTGYSSSDLDDMMKGLGDVTANLDLGDDDDLDEVPKRPGQNLGADDGFDEGDEDGEYDAPGGKEFDDDSGFDEGDPDYDETPKDDAKTIENQPDELKGMVQFKPPENMDFDGVGFFGIPKLKRNMLMTFDELPEKLDSWGGSATRDWPDDDQWWLYNWGVDSTSGMKDISKVIVSFYAYDDYFDNWWYYPERYMAKVLNSGIKYMLTPNWSQATELPKVDSLWQLYRARWIGRYAQEIGIKVIPDITWRDGDMEWLTDYVLATLPKKLPMVALQMQTLDPEAVTGGIDHLKDQVRKVFEILEPEAALIYAGKPGRELMEEVIPDTVKVRYLGTRQEKLSAAAKKKVKKKTI